MDSIHIESQPLFLTKLSLKDGSLQTKFEFPDSLKWSQYLTKPALARFKRSKNYAKYLSDNFQQLLEHRQYLVETVFQNDPQTI